MTAPPAAWSARAAANTPESLVRSTGTGRDYPDPTEQKAPTMPRARTALVCIVWIASACAGANDLRPGFDAGFGAPQGSDGGANGSGACVTCRVDGDCPQGQLCVPFGGDDYCAPTCAGDRTCSPDHACTARPTANGLQVAVCVPRGDVCRGPVFLGGDGGHASALDAGQVAGSVGLAGGRVSRLYFVVIGDTRPASIDDTGGYPTAIISKIFQDVQSLDPVPLFGVSTGDYMFASTGGHQAGPQLDRYLYARGRFSGWLFPAMGNHECTGATASNCGPGNANGMTDNYTQYVTKLLQPIGQSKPYYSLRFDSPGATWTAKFVFVAANAWDAAQASWLESTLAQRTTYTFIVRHEPASASTAPGVSAAEEMMSRHPYTLSIVGHSHTCAKSGPQEVIIGNGGAPLTSGACNYGFGLVQQRPDDSIQVDIFDYATMLRDATFAFAVHPDGSPAP